MIFFNLCKSDCITGFRMLLRQIEPNVSNKMEVFYHPIKPNERKLIFKAYQFYIYND
jgi:hypothetical protein